MLDPSPGGVGELADLLNMANKDPDKDLVGQTRYQEESWSGKLLERLRSRSLENWELRTKQQFIPHTTHTTCSVCIIAGWGATGFTFPRGTSLKKETHLGLANKEGEKLRLAQKGASREVCRKPLQAECILCIVESMQYENQTCRSREPSFEGFDLCHTCFSRAICIYYAYLLGFRHMRA